MIFLLKLDHHHIFLNNYNFSEHNFEFFILINILKIILKSSHTNNKKN